MGSKGVGLDIGTNMLVSAMMNAEGNPVYKRQRDAFLRITPKSKVNQKSIRIALENRKANFIIDESDDFIVVGEDALLMANERNANARRPMSKGVLSPKEKDSLPMIKLIIKSLIGKGEGSDNLVFSIPAEPVDGAFDIFFHTEMMKSYMKEMGFEATPLNEGFAIAFSELLDDNLTGMCISCLVPGTKIYTDKGIVNIEDVVEGDKVLTHKGRFKNVNAVITKQFKGISTKIQLQGYKDSTEYYKFVDDHEILVNRNGNWLWIGCESLKVGDIVGEPIVKQDRGGGKPTMTICERITSSRLFINGDFCCTRVQSIEYEDYEGVVYDLNIEDDHSFSGPFLTIHNCGAGMINTAVVYEGDPVVQFSLLRGGDWIDNAVGKALDEIPSLIQVEKEDDSLDIINPESKIHEAISVYYNVLINYALDNILYELDKSKLPSFREEIPVVVSGGLTLAKGFVNKFKAGIIGKKFPFEVKEVRRAKDPMTAVANGCLMAAVL